jgi:hypothetical protein
MAVPAIKAKITFFIGLIFFGWWCFAILLPKVLRHSILQGSKQGETGHTDSLPGPYN